MTTSDIAFAGYRLEQRLSSDSASVTYRAISETRSKSLTRPVALRISAPLQTADGADAAAIATFLGAVTAAVAVEDPALATVWDAGEAGGRVYVATELVAGTSLDEHVALHGPLTADAAVALLWPIAHALDRAHAAGVVHGAVSPRTVHVCQNGLPPGTPPAILGGFGLEPLLTRQGRADRNRIDIADVYYVAPEQLGGRDVDGRTDQYALACALYHCVAGRPPFVRDAVASLFGAHLFSEAVVPAGREGDRTLRSAVAAGMAKQPADRHPSCVALLRATGHVPGAGRHTVVRRGRGHIAPLREESPVPAVGAGAPAPDLRTASRAHAGRPPSVSHQGSRHAGSQPSAPRRAGSRLVSRRRSVRRRHRRRWRLPISWPVAAMLILAGIVCTLALAALMDGGLTGGAQGMIGQRLSAGSLATSVGGGASEAAGVPWHQRLSDQPIRELGVAGGLVVAAATDGVFALDAGDGSQRWSSAVDGAALSDIVVTGQVVVLRAEQLRALSLDDGTPNWTSADVLAPVGTLVAADDDVVYGIRRGQGATELVAFDVATGAVVWRFAAAALGMDPDTAVAADAAHVVLLADGDLIAVDPASAAAGAITAVHWRRDIVRPWVRSVTLVADTVVVASRDGHVCAYSVTDGRALWCSRIVGLDDHEPAIVAGDDVVAVAMRSHVVTLALESGELEWVYRAPRGLVRTAVRHGDEIVVVDRGGTVHGLGVERGHEHWRASGFGRITALASTGDTIYAGIRDGSVVRLRPSRASEPTIQS